MNWEMMRLQGTIMNKKYYLFIDKYKYEIKIDENSTITKEILNSIPIEGISKNIGGEIFYIVDMDIPFDGTEREIFEVGDVVYWRSQKEKKFAIALFYGNTKFGSGNAPTAASPCIKFASLVDIDTALENSVSGSHISIQKA